MPLRNEDYTDRELLHVIEEHYDGSGWADSEAIARALGMSENGGLREVSSRMAWMVRYKFCDRKIEASTDEEGKKRKRTVYRLTKDGKLLKGGEVPSPVAKALNAMTPGDRLLVMREVASATFSARNEAAQHGIRREYLHQYSRRRTFKGSSKR